VTFPSKLAEPLARSNIPALNAVRAAAVMLVIVYHGGFGLRYVPGAYGVTVFFVLSGFLITWLLLKERARSGGVSIRGFYVRRTLRIVPAFWVYWSFCVLYIWARHRPIPWPHALSALLYVSNYYNALNGDPNTPFSHTWSLATEEQFYLLWPLVFLFLVTRAKQPLRWLLAAVAAVWLYRIVLVSFGVGGSYLYAAFETRCDALLIGCALAFALFERRFGRLWHALTTHPALLLVTLVAMAVTSTIQWWSGLVWTRDIVLGSLGPVLAAVAIVQAIVFSSYRGWRWLEWPVVRYLGLISYSLYLWQQVTLHAANSRLEWAPYWAQAAGGIGLTVLFASASYYLVERPFLRLKDRIGHSYQRGSGAVRVPDESLVPHVIVS
jgi:peptidoglycan/LPS O-acetylase OafA/YrhL